MPAGLGKAADAMVELCKNGRFEVGGVGGVTATIANAILVPVIGHGISGKHIPIKNGASR